LITGAISGGIEAAIKQRNMCYGSEVGKYRSNWTPLANSDLPDVTYDIRTYDIMHANSDPMFIYKPFIGKCLMNDQCCMAVTADIN